MREKEIEFRFKKFTVRHDGSTMKVGTDAVLLGAWADVDKVNRILEVGTGCGVIALMLAQRVNKSTLIDAIEIDVDSVNQAKENIYKSEWREKITIHHSSFQEWNSTDHYDLIVSNPPFFSNSLLPPDQLRSQARHSITLTPSQLLHQSKKLLSPNGRLCVVLPFREGNDFITMAASHQFFLSKQLSFFSRQGKPQERWLLEFSFNENQVHQSSLILYTSENKPSEEYKKLTSEFYLDY